MDESLTYKTEKRIYDFLPHKPESMAATLFIIGMSTYYLWRMVAITPQYDELYTYYTFISRGPLYAAIHWPLPNNHVGYSVLSALLDMFGNPFIGLRGVSYICAIVNLVLVYFICKRYYSHGLPFAGMLLYSCMQIVNDYSVQGRGYTLGTTCFLSTVFVAGRICSIEDSSISNYIILAIAFIMGLYTVPSSIYWVLPMSFSIAAYLLINTFKSRGVRANLRDNAYFKKFRTFFLYGVIAAAVTTCLYGLIWFAIGSNLLVKTEGSAYFGMSHAQVLMKAPFASLKTGIDYMLSQPYIQSLAPDDFRMQFVPWVSNLFNYMLPGIAYVIPYALILGMVIALYECVMHFTYSRTVINIIIVCNVLITGLMLIIQLKLPYLRVFSYGAFIVTACVCTCLERIINTSIRMYNYEMRQKDNSSDEQKVTHSEFETAVKSGKWYNGIGAYIPVLIIIIVFCTRIVSVDFNTQLAGRETELFNTLYIANVTKRNNIAVLDCDQQYLLKFGWDIDCEKTDVTGADCVIVDRNMMTPGYSGEDFWKFYQNYETMDWDYIETMRAIYENENFILYIK